jgi:hypothetical protein
MSEEKKEEKHNIFLYILFATVLISISISFYSFYYKKNFDFFIETSCNPETETCFFRDCEGNSGACPPNNLSYYNQYTIKAGDFKYCLNEDCKEACISGSINCSKIECTDSDISDEVCLLPTSLTEEPINLEPEI